MKLLPEEREVLVTWNDLDRNWYVYVDNSCSLFEKVKEKADKWHVPGKALFSTGVEYIFPAEAFFSM